MSTLRRRILGDSSSDPSRDASPAKGEPEVSVPLRQFEKLKKRKGKRKSWLLFSLGGFFGIAIAAFFAEQHDVISFDGLTDFNLDAFIDVIPAGIVKDVNHGRLPFSRQPEKAHELKLIQIMLAIEPRTRGCEL